MIQKTIKDQDEFYILAESILADDRTRVLKYGNTFAVFDRYGDIQSLWCGEEGIYHSETRYLSRLEFRIDQQRPFLLSSSILEDNTLLTVDLTNPDMKQGDEVLMHRGSLHIFRSKFLWQGACYERFRFGYYENTPRIVHFSLCFENDFSDIFEVRGAKREKRGKMKPPRVHDETVYLSYQGLDGEERETRIHWFSSNSSAKLTKTTSSELFFDIKLAPHSFVDVFLQYVFVPGKRKVPIFSYDEAFCLASQDRETVRKGDCGVVTSNEQFNDWIDRSYADIHMMITQLPEGFYPYAGVPWFNTVFGRDGIFTALFYLWINPKIARGVLTCLAAYQAKACDAEKEAEPGKILHELRKGEMAKLNEVPFGLYYGSVDATPLFVVLAGAYYERTGDLETIKTIWPHIELALCWIKEYGDVDGDGFVEYGGKKAKGLVNQGWKDSEDSIFHKDGSQAQGPIALCEVQGYVYDAFQKAAKMAKALGHKESARHYFKKAKILRDKFIKVFWSDEISMYVLALDGKKRPCQVRASNAGHCLFSGIAPVEHARKMATIFSGQDFFTGWGIRTLSSQERLYNPMSYHNGSIWPHDNAILALGLARYGFKNLAMKLIKGFFDASLFLDLHRLPELFCGFPRRSAEGPTLYPVACLPQAWASASVFFFLQAILGLSIDSLEKKIIFHYPVLPECIQEITLKNITVGKSQADVLLQRHRKDVSIHMVSRKGPVEIMVRK
ncbi:MAG: amylo-alpha-1,6-glucosidase [Verrucomicrobiae bacterium]|nr:amylo-alpha-1,6-glucosidase [Verrucomicrobiae bacterium]